MPAETPVDLNAAMQNVHHHIEGLLEDARVALIQARSGDTSRARSCVNALLNALTAHHRAEDQVLFPRVAQLGQSAADLVASYGEDHEDVVRVMGRVQKAVGQSQGQINDPEAVRRALADLERAMARHFGSEESGIDAYLDRLRVFAPEVHTLVGSSAWRGGVG